MAAFDELIFPNFRSEVQGTVLYPISYQWESKPGQLLAFQYLQSTKHKLYIDWSPLGIFIFVAPKRVVIAELKETWTPGQVYTAMLNLFDRLLVHDGQTKSTELIQAGLEPAESEFSYCLSFWYGKPEEVKKHHKAATTAFEQWMDAKRHEDKNSEDTKQYFDHYASRLMNPKASVIKIFKGPQNHLLEGNDLADICVISNYDRREAELYFQKFRIGPVTQNQMRLPNATSWFVDPDLL